MSAPSLVVNNGNRPRLLWVGDACCPSGFGLATHRILEALDHRCGRGGEYDVTVLGINYRGDPYDYPYPVYAALAGGDVLGVERLIWMCDLFKPGKPDAIIIQNDPWNFPYYTSRLRAKSRGYDGEYADVPVIGIVAVDGKNCAGRDLNGLSLAMFWTRFGLEEARAGGYAGPAFVNPLGVDLNVFYPEDKRAARQRRGLPEVMLDSFIVGNVNRNQPRKRWDLTVKYFAEWVHSGRMKDAYLYLHTAPTGDTGTDVLQLAQYYGVYNRMLLVEPETFYGFKDDEMRDTYNSFDVQITTTQGEGFGLTTFEGMACGIPQIVPDWSALGELIKDAGLLVPCSTTAVGPPYVNVIGGIPDETAFVKALDQVFSNRQLREELSVAGLDCVRQDRYRWENVGEGFALVLKQMLRAFNRAKEKKEVEPTTV